MSVREPLRFRKALLAGAVALALTGTGAAVAWSAGGTSSQPPQSAPGQVNTQNTADKREKPAKAQRSRHLHSEGVVKKPDGSFQAVLEQRGTVEAVSGTSITVRSEDGYSQSYSIGAGTKVTLVPARAADGAPATGDDGKRLRPSNGTIADIAPGDVVRISGVKDGDQATAERVVKGAGDWPGPGPGRGHEKSHGKGPAK